MSKYAEELDRRIQSGEPVHVTREWFLQCLSKNEPGCQYFADLSVQEQMFLERTVDAFTAGQEQQAQKPRPSGWWHRLRR
jgi:hypothetical protein